MMSADDTLKVLEVLEDQAQDGAPGFGRLAGRDERRLTIRISAPSGAHVDVGVPESAVSDGCTVRELLMITADEAHNDFDGTSEELARRRTLLQRLPEQLAGVTGAGGGAYMLMTPDGDLGHRQVHPDAPVEVVDRRTQEIAAHFVVAPYHTGGR